MKIWLVSAMMALSVLGAHALAPGRPAVAPEDDFSLEKIIPAQIGNWRLDDSIVPVLPRKQENDDSLEARIYDQTLVRTYRNGADDRIMLVIAYGRDQSDALQVHLPEACYASQGFAVRRAGEAVIDSGFAAFPVKRLATRRGLRHEPVTYWTRVGDKVAPSMLSRQWAKLTYGIGGRIPDGVLVRISSISGHPDRAFVMQEKFARELVRVVDPKARRFLLGEHGR